MSRFLRSVFMCLGLLCVPATGLALAGEKVLVGTDVVDRSTFQEQPVSSATEGTYTAEQGGATLTGELRVNGSVWHFSRALTEPGSEPVTRDYTLTESGSGLSSEGSDVRILAVKDGILVLESSTDELLPSDLWILYDRKGGQ